MQFLNKRQRRSAVRRVRELLRAQIVHSCFSDGVLPSEFQLAAEYRVSRGIVREVLGLLREEGLIDRLPGAGTFVVAQERSPVGIDSARTLAEALDQGGSHVGWELLDLGRQPAPPLVAERLELACDDDVVFMERSTTLGGHPLMTRTSWFPLAVGAPLLRPEPDFRHSVYALIEHVFGYEVAFVRLALEAAPADQVIAPLLDLAVGAPIQLMERVVYGTDARPLEYSFARARGDRYMMTTVMPRLQRHYHVRGVQDIDGSQTA
jgi:GntR family transcriptional regulator